MLSWEYPPNLVGGLGRHVNGLAQALSDLGVHVTVLTGAKGEGHVTDDGAVKVVWSGLPTVWARSFVENIHHLNYALVRDAIALHSEAAFDLIHAHDWSVAFAAASLKHGFRLPLVATIHATERGRNLGLGTDEQKYISQGDWFLAFEGWKVICCSEAMRKEVMDYISVPPDKIRVIPNATHPENFTSHFNRKLFRSKFVKEDEKLVLFVGRLVYEKGVHVLLRAAARLNKKSPQARFVLVGKGNPAWYRRVASQAGVSERVTFLESCPDRTLWNLYRAADVAVFPSLYEPFGMVAIESMAAGTLTLVSDVGGLAEIVEHGVDGIKFPPGDEVALAKLLQTVLANGLSTQAICRRARDKVRRLYTWPSVAQETLKLYRSVLQQRRRTPWHDHLSPPDVNDLHSPGSGGPIAPGKE